MDAAKNEHATALGRQRLDDDLYLTQRFAGVQLRLDRIFAAQQFQVGHGFEADHLVTAGGVDDEVAGDGEKIGAACRHIFPIFRRIGAGHDFGDHVVQFMGGGQNAPQTTAQCCFLW